MPRAKKNALRNNPTRTNPKVPWEKYERHVRNVLESAGGSLDLRVEGKRTLKGLDGEYEVDAYAELTVFGGAVIKIVVECKRHTNPVGRAVVESLFSRTLSLGANKAMLFSTSGFQSGAITFARAHGIALVRLDDRRAKQAAYCVAEPPVTYAAQFITGTAFLPSFLSALFAYEPEPPDYERDDLPEYEPAIVCVLRSARRPSTVIGSENPRAFRAWLLSSPSPSVEQDKARG